MSSKRNPYKATSNYVIRINPTGDILGKIRSNILSSEYTIYDCRSLCRQQQQQQQQQIEQRPSVVDSEGALRAELGAVIYRKVPSYDATTASCIPPRKMQVCINSLGGGSDISTPQSYKKPKTRAEEMLQLLKYKLDTAKRNFSVLESRIPNWDDNLEAYVLNFGGRVTMESQKNFQLVQADTVKEQIVVLQFGRVAKDEFTMDFRWPLSPFLAFALSLTACDSKVGRD
jgi:tubby-related protein 1